MGYESLIGLLLRRAGDDDDEANLGGKSGDDFTNNLFTDLAP